MNENQIIEKYMQTLNKIENITTKLRSSGKYTGEQLINISMTLFDELPQLVFTDEELEIISNNEDLKQMSFSEINEKYTNKTR